MTQGVWRAVLGGIAITTAFGILPAAANSLLPLTPDALSWREMRIEVAQLVPITVAPYRWTARKKPDGSIVLSGYEPDSETQSALLNAAGLKALDASSIASGAPEGFASDAETALALLELFEDGTADLTGSGWTVTGRVDGLDAAKKLEALIARKGLSAKGWVLDFTLPQPEPVAGENVVADGKTGNSSSAAESDSGPAIETVSSDGAPDASSVEELTLDEAAPDVATSDDATVVPEVPAEVAPAPAPKFSFAAMKQGDTWLLGGDAPIDAFHKLVDIHLGTKSGGRLAIVPAPEGFGASAMKALDLMSTLESGRVLFDGSTWTLAGVAASEDVASKTEKAASDEGFVGDISISASATPAAVESEPAQVASAPEPPPEVNAPAEPIAETPALPVAKPYIWQADLTGDGKIDFSGYVPDADVKAYFDEQSHGGSNLARLADGAPDGFSGDVLAGLDALKQLSFGQVGFNGTSWRLTGMAADVASAEQARAVLAARADTWTVNISQPAPVAEVASAEPEAPDAESNAAPPARADFSELGLSTEPTHPRPPPPPPLPMVTPFVWQAKLQPSGAVDFSGYVPAEALKRFLDVRSKGGSNDTQLAAGAPEGFAGAVLSGLDALSELDTGRLDFDGGNWSLTGATGDAAAKTRALASLGPFAENWVVAIATPQPPPAPPVRPAPPPAVDKGAPDFVFTAEKTRDDGITLSGDVPADATRAFLGVIAGKSGSDALTARPGAPGGFVADVVGGLRALATLDSGKLVYKDFSWSLAGKSASDTTRAAVSAAVSSLPGGKDWSVDIVPPTPLEICVAEVTAFDDRNAILFSAGSSRITEDSLPAIDEIAKTLKACPSAVVHVEGHTDSDGDAESNLILSVSRAEAVVDKLIDLGVGEGRIYAIGYGESLPIASNDTNDGKRRNRRIVIAVSDGPG